VARQRSRRSEVVVACFVLRVASSRWDVQLPLDATRKTQHVSPTSPAAVNLDHIQSATRPVRFAGREKSSPRGQIKLPSARRVVGIIARTSHRSGIRRRRTGSCRDDRQLGKPHEVDDRRRAPLDLGEQTSRRAFLMGARNRQHHPPVTAQHVGLPRATTLCFQQLFPGPAEIPQPHVA